MIVPGATPETATMSPRGAALVPAERDERTGRSGAESCADSTTRTDDFLGIGRSRSRLPHSLTLEHAHGGIGEDCGGAHAGEG